MSSKRPCRQFQASSSRVNANASEETRPPNNQRVGNNPPPHRFDINKFGLDFDDDIHRELYDSLTT